MMDVLFALICFGFLLFSVLAWILFCLVIALVVSRCSSLMICQGEAREMHSVRCFDSERFCFSCFVKSIC